MVRWVARSLSLFLGAALGFLALEAAARCLPPFRNTVSFQRFHQRDNPVVKDIGKGRRRMGWALYRPSNVPGLGYELVPGIDRPDADIRVNAHGVIGTAYDLAKPAGTTRILLIGDSITEENTFATHLGRLLNGPDGVGAFEVWNGGVGGYQINQYAAFFRYRGVRFQPDLVIINFGLNDFNLENLVVYETKDGLQAFSNPGALTLLRPAALHRTLFLRSAAYRLLAVRYNERAGAIMESEDPRDLGWLTAERYLKQIQIGCRANGARLFAVVFPYFKSRETYLPYEKDDYERIAGSLRRLGIDHVDLHDHFPKTGLEKLRAEPEDVVHGSPEAMRFAAERVHEILTARGYLSGE